MNYDLLRTLTLEANLELPRLGLVSFTWGNVSSRDMTTGVIAIKPSGVAYTNLRPTDIVIVDNTGRVIEGSLRPSSDLPTHLELYRNWPHIGGIVHTHSTWATIWAQTCRSIPVLGTTHADHFLGEIPSTKPLTQCEVEGDYELETGKAIITHFLQKGLNPNLMPAVLVANHGPFTWGINAAVSVHHAAVLEQVAYMASQTLHLAPNIPPIPDYLLQKHFQRKQGPAAYYGQNP